MNWFSFFILILLFAYWGTPSDKTPSIVNKFSQVLLIIVLSVMAGLGGIASQDHPEYVRVYNETKDLSFISFFSHVTLRDFSFKTVEYTYEVGYIFINILGHKLLLGEAGFFFFVSLITNTFIVKTIYRFKYPIIAVLVFVTSRAFLQESNIVRQTLAISMLVYSLKYIESGQLKKYLLFILISASIHTSVIYCSLLYLLRFVNTQTRKKTLLYNLIIIWLLSVVFIREGFSLTSSLVNTYTTYGDLLEESKEVIGGIQVDYLTNLAVAFLLLFVSFYKKTNPTNIDVYFTCIVLAAIFSNISVSILYFYRISLIFTVIYCLSIATKFSEIKFLNISNYSLPLLLLVVYRLYIATRIIVTNSEAMGSEFYSLDKFFSI